MSDFCDPIDGSLPDSSIHGISQARKYRNGLPFPSPGDHPDLGIEHKSPHCRQILYHWPPGKPKVGIMVYDSM